MKKRLLIAIMGLCLALTACSQNTADTKDTSEAVENSEETDEEQEENEEETEVDWKSAYADFLRDNEEEISSKSSLTPKFELAYVTNDNVPELIIITGSSHADGAYVYTLNGDEVVPVNHEITSDNSYGVYGAFIYKEYESLIYVGNMHQGIITDCLIEIEDTTSYTKYDLGNDSGKAVSEDEIKYWEGDEDISKAEYESKYELYGFDEVAEKFKKIEYEDANDIDESNIEDVFEN